MESGAAVIVMCPEVNPRGAGRYLSCKTERDFVGDQQGSDALEGLQLRAERENLDWLYETACARPTEESFPDSG